MISFTCDYNEGAHPLILQRLTGTNMQQEPGYGDDSFCLSARRRIRQATQCPDADVHFLVGGTQTNATILDAIVPHYAAVISVESGHIAVHESGAIEHSGHKVVTLPAEEGKLMPQVLRNYLQQFFADPTWPHMAHPKAVYISFPTEYGTIYSKAELTALYAICREYHLKLFVDGARLGYGLASPDADVSLPELAQLCDVFYIGGTKIGALCGEAVVFPKGDAPDNLFTIMKQHGAVMAKGRLLGLQFDTLFTDDLYLRISAHAIAMAQQLQSLFWQHDIPFYITSPTNQQFPILTAAQVQQLQGQVEFEVWQPLPDGRFVTRFATSWATPQAHIDQLRECLEA
ncbi:MAG: amino acid lyase [Bacteroidaceae bacterium]|nr:amino acid lyase [Bacteroidaceae bacterium]